MNDLQVNRIELIDSQRQMLMQRGFEAVVDRVLVQQDVQILYKVGVKKFGMDEFVFFLVLFIRYEYQMRVIFEEYQKVNNSFFMINLLDFCFFVIDRYYIYVK